MKISRSTGYALLAVGYIAKNEGDALIMSQDIAREYEIPLEYLLKILQQLVRANVLRSKRGPSGGFSLAKSAKKISMLQIIEAVDGPLSSHLSLAEQSQGAKLGSKVEKAFDKAITQARTVFDKTKLADLIEGK
ncbi:MAG: Rrf2 family transcriptional regulator [Sedimentisphaerales bacterium]|nr:Rrf2 family transcriptional regulator [Sedimentisphaerales bacterium]